MNRKLGATKALLAIFFFAGVLAHGSALAACVAEGPSLSDTSAYITDALRKSHPTFVITTNIETGHLEINHYQSDMDVINDRDRYDVSVMSLDCSRYSPGAFEGGTSAAFLYCKGGDDCAEHFYKTGTYSSTRYVAVNAPEGPDQADRLARALSHLVYLLQKEYRAAHESSNDPFVKPQ